MRKTKKKSLFPWKRPQSRCHYVPCYSSVRAGLRNRQQALLMRWVVQIPPSPVKTSTLAIPKGICRDVFFCFKTKRMEPEGRAEDAKNKKEISFPMEKTAKPLSLRPLLQFCKGGTA